MIFCGGLHDTHISNARPSITMHGSRVQGKRAEPEMHTCNVQLRSGQQLTQTKVVIKNQMPSLSEESSKWAEKRQS
eukprot:4214934-Amphidinium_carterae.1